MKRRSFLSGSMAGPLWLKTRFLAVKTKFFGRKTPAKYVVVEAENPQGDIVTLPNGDYLFPNGSIVTQEEMAAAIERFIPELNEHIAQMKKLFAKGSVVPENSVRLQNQQDTGRLCHIVTWMNSGTDTPKGPLSFSGGRRTQLLRTTTSIQSN